MAQVPFPLLFMEKMPRAEINGHYDQEAQVFRLVQTGNPLTAPTFVETDTGGYGDTDTDSD